jgi:hypothetical protein
MEDGKLSLDLLIGLSIFLFTFIFIANFLPGVFADVRNEINLAHQAYRISALLVEDLGFNSSWDTDITVSNCQTQEFRPGLAVYNSDSGTLFNNLSVTKIRKFAELLNDPVCRERLRLFLGLNLSEFGGNKYKINVSLKNLEDELIKADGAILLNHGDPMSLGQIVKFEKLVYLSQMVDNCDIIAERCVAKLEVAVWI